MAVVVMWLIREVIYVLDIDMEKLFQNPMHCGKRMQKQDVTTRL